MSGSRAWQPRLGSMLHRTGWALWIVKREATWRRGLLSWPAAAFAAAAGFVFHTLPFSDSRPPSEAVMQLAGVCACLYGGWQRLRASGADIGGVLMHKQAAEDRDGVAALVWVRALLAGAQMATCAFLGAFLAGLLNEVWGHSTGVTFAVMGISIWWFNGSFAVIVGLLVAFRCAQRNQQLSN